MAKVALVVGGTGGLGRACAEELASTGYKTVVAGRSKSKGDDAVKAITAQGGEATFIAFDITNAASIKALHEETVATYGRLDAAVNGAGIMGNFAKLLDQKLDDINELLQVNVVGVALCMQEQVRAMQSNPGGSGGRIVNFSSIYGLHGCKWGSIYSMTKYALVGLTKSTALEYSNPKDNILINAVAPGIVPTDMVAALADVESFPEGELKDDMSVIIGMYPQGRFGETADVARAVRYLVESPWTTGTVLEVDGGFGAK